MAAFDRAEVVIANAICGPARMTKAHKDAARRVIAALDAAAPKGTLPIIIDNSGRIGRLCPFTLSVPYFYGEPGGCVEDEP